MSDLKAELEELAGFIKEHPPKAVCGCCFRTVDKLPNGFACAKCLADKSHPDIEAEFHGYDPLWDQP